MLTLVNDAARRIETYEPKSGTNLSIMNTALQCTTFIELPQLYLYVYFLAMFYEVTGLSVFELRASRPYLQ